MIDATLFVINQSLVRVARGKKTFSNITVKASDVRVAEVLIEKLNLDRETINRHSLDEAWDFFDSCNIMLPKEVTTIEEIPEGAIETYGLDSLVSPLRLTEKRILEPLRIQYPHVRFGFDVARKAGLGYYEHVTTSL